MRADAVRNRERILDAARVVFREQGYDASLDEVAKRAGVGAGTLYRHFSCREELVDALMQSWMDRVSETTEKAMAFEGGPRDLLLRWFESYVALISMHKGGPAKLTSAISDPDSPIATKCQTLVDANRRVLEHLAGEITLRPGVDAVQVSRLVGGVATIADNADLDDAAVKPLLEVLVDGILVTA